MSRAGACKKIKRRANRRYRCIERVRLAQRKGEEFL
jgi:hypothetical protein